jgi:hypothetical protein
MVGTPRLTVLLKEPTLGFGFTPFMVLDFLGAIRFITKYVVAG